MKAREPNIGLCRHLALILREHHGSEVVDRAVQQAGLPHPLDVSDAISIPVEMEAAFFQAAAEYSQDIDLPLRAGFALGHAAALPGYVARHASTLREALLAGAKALSVVRQGMALSLQEQGDIAFISMSVSDPRLLRYPRHSEGIFAGVVGQIRAFTARPFNPAALSFQHTRVPAGGTATSEAGCTIEFGAEQTAMVCSKQALEREIRGRDDSLHALLVAHTEMLAHEIEQRGVSFAEQVELYVQSQLPIEERGSLPSADRVARALGVSRRTLTRRLGEAQTSFRDVTAKVRIRWASRQLQETDRPIGEIASRLGYSSRSAFTVAFRRATGQSPRGSRREGPRLQS